MVSRRFKRDRHQAERHYGPAVLPKAEAAIAHFLELPEADLRNVARALGMQHDFFERLGFPGKPARDSGLSL